MKNGLSKKEKQKRLSELPAPENLQRFITPFAKKFEDFLSVAKKREDALREITQEIHAEAFNAGRANAVDGITITNPVASSLALTIGDVSAASFIARQEVEKTVSEILQKYFPIRYR